MVLCKGVGEVTNLEMCLTTIDFEIEVLCRTSINICLSCTIVIGLDNGWLVMEQDGDMLTHYLE